MPSLALEDVGDQGSLGVIVLKGNLEGIDPQNREAWRSGVRRISLLQLDSSAEDTCKQRVKIGLVFIGPVKQKI